MGGAMAPLGFFDPAGFSKVGDEEGFRNLRPAELKHGRVAMMAALGFVAQQYVKLPGFEKVPAGVGADGGAWRIWLRGTVPVGRRPGARGVDTGPEEGGGQLRRPAGP